MRYWEGVACVPGSLDGFLTEAGANCSSRRNADIAVWRVLLETPVSLLQCPGWPGVAKLAVVYDRYAAELRSFNRPIADYLADILLAWRDAESGADGPGGKIIWDAACVAALTLPAAAHGFSPASAASWTHSRTSCGAAAASGEMTKVEREFP